MGLHRFTESSAPDDGSREDVEGQESPPSRSFRAMVANLPMAAVWVCKERLYFNRLAEETCGWRSESLGTLDDWFRKAHGEGGDAARDRYRKLRESRFGHCLSERVRGEDGIERPVEIAAYSVDDGEIWLLWPSDENRDIISALKENECRIRAVLDSTVDAIVTIDSSGRIIDVNPATLRMFGYGQEELIGHNVSILMPSPHRDEHDGYLARYLETGEARVIGIGREVRGLRKDGSSFPLELAVSRIDHLGMFCGIMRDISERRDLEQQVVKAVVDERRRSAQDLHDGLGSLLTAIHLRLNAMTKALAKLDSGLQDEARVISGLVKKALGQTRAIARGLDPVGPEPEDLMSSLTELASEMTLVSGVCCEFECPDPVLIPDKALGKQLYRIAQEATTNAIKHGGGGRIVIRLTRDGGNIVLSVTDNGVGIDAGNPGSGGNGLNIMRYRAAMVGGAVSIGEQAGGGTVVRCEIPLPVADGTSASLRPESGSGH